MGDLGEEKRRFPRLNAKIRVEIDYHNPETGESEKGEGESKDLAIGGIAFFNDYDIEIGSYIVIYCYLPGEDEPLAFFARVIRCEKEDDKYLLSSKFLRYEKRDILKLEKYIEKGT